MVRSWGSEMLPCIFTFIFRFVSKSSIYMIILSDMPREIRKSKMERLSTYSLSKSMKATNTGLTVLVVFRLGVFHWSFARIILSIICERVDNRV